MCGALDTKKCRKNRLIPIGSIKEIKLDPALDPLPNPNRVFNSLTRRNSVETDTIEKPKRCEGGIKVGPKIETSNMSTAKRPSEEELLAAQILHLHVTKYPFNTERPSLQNRTSIKLSKTDSKSPAEKPKICHKLMLPLLRHPD